MYVHVHKSYKSQNSLERSHKLLYTPKFSWDENLVNHGFYRDFAFFYSQMAMFCHYTRAQSKFMQVQTFVDGFQSANIKPDKN